MSGGWLTSRQFLEAGSFSSDRPVVLKRMMDAHATSATEAVSVGLFREFVAAKRSAVTAELQVCVLLQDLSSLSSNNSRFSCGSQLNNVCVTCVMFIRANVCVTCGPSLEFSLVKSCSP